MPSTITDNEVKKIAALARLELAPKERKEAALYLTAVSGYAELLAELDVSRVERHALSSVESVTLRSDAPRDFERSHELRTGAHFTQSGFMKTPKVFDEQSSDETDDA